jgi:hypothetical protein
MLPMAVGLGDCVMMERAADGFKYGRLARWSLSATMAITVGAYWRVVGYNAANGVKPVRENIE